MRLGGENDVIGALVVSSVYYLFDVECSRLVGIYERRFWGILRTCAKCEINIYDIISFIFLHCYERREVSGLLIVLSCRF